MKEHLERAKLIYADIKNGFDKSGNMVFQTGFNAFEITLKHVLDSPEGLSFCDSYLFHIVEVLTSQSSSNPNRSLIEATISLGVEITLKLLPKYPRFLNVLCCAFGLNEFYGHKSKYQSSFGNFDTFRQDLILKFAQQRNMYSLILDTLNNPSLSWIPCYLYANLVSSLLVSHNQVFHLVSDKLRNDILYRIMDIIKSASDDNLRKETDESLIKVVQSLNSVVYVGLELKQDSTMVIAFQSFWFDLIKRLFNSGSLVIKFCGLDLLNNLIAVACENKPYRKSYTASGCSLDFINGTYNLVRFDPKLKSPIYEKSTTPSERIISIKKYTLSNNGGTKWFILYSPTSNINDDQDYFAGPVKRGTVDLFHYPPSLIGWKGIQLHVNEAPPTLQGGSEFYIDPKYVSEDCYLYVQLIKWLSRVDFFSMIFGPSTHREIVSRSVCLINFLIEENLLLDVHIQGIWKLGIESMTQDIVDETFNILSSIFPKLSLSHVNLVVSSANQLLLKNGDIEFSKVATFVEHFSKDSNKLFLEITNVNTIVSLLQIFWNLFCHERFSEYKNNSQVIELMKKCLMFEKCKSFIMDHTIESLTIIKNESVNSNLVYQQLKCLKFLLSRCADDNIAKKLSELDFDITLIDEIQRYVKEARKVLQSTISDEIGSNNQKYSDGLSLRLHILRQYYGLSDLVNISIETVNTLWMLLGVDHKDRIEFFKFVSNGCIQNEDSQVFGLPNTLVYILHECICSPMVHWEYCGLETFECFSIYYNTLKEVLYVDKQETLHVALETMWVIALYLPVYSEDQKKSLINYLLLCYDDFAVVHTESSKSILHKIFDVFDGSNKSDDIKKRCSDILYLAIIRSNSYDMPPSHAARGKLGRFSIKYLFSHVETSYSYSNDISFTNDSGENILDIHPMETIYSIKKRIMQQCQSSDINAISLYFEDRLLVDIERANIIGLYQDVELKCIFRVSSTYQTYVTTVQTSLPPLQSINAYCDIADNEKFFRLLIQYSMHNSDIGSSIWDVLMILPTNSKIFSGILAWEPSVFKQLIQMLQLKELSELAYHLQIVNYLLQPSKEFEDIVTSTQISNFHRRFKEYLGFQDLVTILTQLGNDDGFLIQDVTSALLHSIYLFVCPSMHVLANEITSSDEDRDVSKYLKYLCVDSSILEKLLFVARAATSGDNSTVQYSLSILTMMLQYSNVISDALINNKGAKHLLSTVLRSNSSHVRQYASDFAVEFGKNLPQVFSWMIEILKDLKLNDSTGIEIFQTTKNLLKSLALVYHHKKTLLQEYFLSLAELLLYNVCITIPDAFFSLSKENEEVNNTIIEKYLELLSDLISIDMECVNTHLQKKQFKLQDILIRKYLLPLPKSDNNDYQDNFKHICDNPTSRKFGFNILNKLMLQDSKSALQVLEELIELKQLYSSNQGSSTGSGISRVQSLNQLNDVRNSDIKFVGLKNQGCTCYSNSLLQQLFMNYEFREAIMRTPLPEKYRSTLWHISDEDLVGAKCLFEWKDKSWHQGEIIDFDLIKKHHTVKYENGQEVIFNIHFGRGFDFETGRIKVIQHASDNNNGNDNKDNNIPMRSSLVYEEDIDDRHRDAFYVLEQLQRTFCFLKFSKRRYFDPKNLVEACKSLNLNFDVYHQNDAAEFCDQLLDRLETATKGKYTHVDTWTNILKSNVFGGHFLTQKIPKECSKYEANKQDCGHWQSSRQESFLKIECIIRGKENIYESLSELIQGELMDGENKINCDVCQTKMATVRRTCIETLPKTLIVHLKRFDLDFQTFETVKLNSKMEFPLRLNLFKYVKEGIETDMDTDANLADYDYDIQGILVHAGVAQGGHYYSFIKDPNASSDTNGGWYRFDDDEVSIFSPDQIPQQCYGGTFMTNGRDSVRTSNALILFYTKVNPVLTDALTLVRSISNPLQHSYKVGCRDMLLDGYQAFQNEVNESNLQFLLSKYLLDQELQVLIQQLLNTTLVQKSIEGKVTLTTSIVSNAILHESPSFSHQVFKYAMEYLFDVIMKSSERTYDDAWETTLKNCFVTNPLEAVYFLKELLTRHQIWLSQYLLHSSDYTARQLFLSVLVEAIKTIYQNSSITSSTLIELFPLSNLRVDIQSNNLQYLTPDALIACILQHVTTLLYQVPIFGNNADEYFFLIHDLAMMSEIRKFMNHENMIAKLCYFIIPDSTHDEIKKLFEVSKKLGLSKGGHFNFMSIHYAIYEAILSLLGTTTLRRVKLVQDCLNGERRFTPLAEEAFTRIFHDSLSSPSINYLDSPSFTSFVGKVFGNPSMKYIKEVFDNTCDGKLYLDGFLGHFAKQAITLNKDLWAILIYFGYRPDLTHLSNPSSSKTNEIPIERGLLEVSSQSKLCLISPIFYELGLTANLDAIKQIMYHVCFKEEKTSRHLIVQLLKQFHQETIQGNQIRSSKFLTELLSVLLSIDDEFKDRRLEDILFHDHTGLITIINNESVNTSKPMYYQSSVLEIYIDFIKNLCINHSELPNSIRALGITSLKMQDTIGKLRLVIESELCEDEINKIKQSSVIIQDAGFPEVNGLYVLDKIDYKLNSGIYCREGVFEKKSAMFTLYKCEMNAGSMKEYKWFISITPPGHSPGTKYDIDFYSVNTSLKRGLFPPSTHWMVMKQQTVSRGELPSIIVLVDGNPYEELSIHFKSVSYDSNSPQYNRGSINYRCSDDIDSFSDTAVPDIDGDDYGDEFSDSIDIIGDNSLNNSDIYD